MTPGVGGTVCVLVVGALCISNAQAPATPAFAAASVKANKSGDERTDGLNAGNRFRMSNETFWRLIGEAYATPAPLPRYRIIGGPSWMDSDRFDVDAVTDGASTTEQKRLMLRTLLADRFKLAIHQETRESATFDLVLARSEKNLVKLRLSKFDCACAPQAPVQAPAGNHAMHD